MVLLGTALRKLVDHGIEYEGLLEERGQLDQPRDETALALDIRAVMFREGDHEHIERRELRGERLGRCDADHGARAGQRDEIGLADERALGGVAYRERREISGLFAGRQGRKCVGGLAGLAD